MFAEDTPWQVPWLMKITPQLEELVGRAPEKTIFTRFIPPKRAEDAPGAWRSYYEKWRVMTGEMLAPEMLELVPAMARHTPPARSFAKTTFSPWLGGELNAHLQETRVDTLAISGGETDVCVLATVLGAIDLGYHVILLTDAVCSGADETHDASIKLLGDRFSVQLRLMTTEDFLDMDAEA
ncbi:cysteine hydrolase [Limoniibacter endophyticus]|uniref:Cysteine hydrolase n=2 Tax=Limoniibacter endophyticus TaxID=1565040 RepID=A0A8J3GHC9_9HYPH|nr:cysteine hydrolase [Limoniibacter endophyticus]